MRIEACFDSHVHWPATGEFSSRLNLSGLRAPADVANLKIQPNHVRGDWLLGFGWDETGWPEVPHRRHLDAVFGDQPVAFARCDGHQLWVNTEALRRAGIFNSHNADIAGGKTARDQSGCPTGLLLENARVAVEKLIPLPSSMELRRNLLKGVKTFNDAGFTHIRDMTCSAEQWSEAIKLDDSGLLTLAVEEYFWLKDAAVLDKCLSLAVQARHAQTANLRVKGVKLFLDGALGSEGAWLSRCYPGCDSHGVTLWERAALREVLLKSWEQGLHVALHAIGDAAADWAVTLAAELKAEGHIGPLHLEHAEVVRQETAAKMKALAIECHLQPAHWLSDQRWLKAKLGDLYEHAFPWRRLQEVEVDFDFGSDAPIEPPSLMRTFQALRESAEAGIPRLLGTPTAHMGHRDLAWAPNSFTLLADEQPTQVVFRGEHLI